MMDKDAPTRESSKYAKLDHRHRAEQDAIGEGKRFAPGDYLVKIVRCYAVAGDDEIWAPETDVTYFVAECSRSNGEVACWVNRLRFNGPAQLKQFLIEALRISHEQHHEITEAKCEEIVGPTNPLAGTRMWLRVGEPKGGPGGYMHHQWRRDG